MRTEHTVLKLIGLSISDTLPTQAQDSTIHGDVFSQSPQNSMTNLQ